MALGFVDARRYATKLAEYLTDADVDRDESLVSQRDHRIHRHGAAGGDITGSHRNTKQKGGHGAKCYRISRGHVIE
jgi:hypothetical protein